MDGASSRRSFLRATLPPAALAAMPAAARGQSADAARIDVRGFGARGDGKADDTAAIQAAIDHALRNRLVAVHVPPGRYRTTDTLHLGHGDDFHTVALLGEGSFAYAGATAGATVVPERFDRPAINIQGARGSVIRNIGVLGRNIDFADRTFGGHRNIGEADPAGWLDPALAGGLARHAPYAAITVDAFSGTMREDSYAAPARPAWLRDSGAPQPHLFSSDIIIDRCWIGGFAAGIAVQPGDADGNGDFVKITNCCISHCVYAIAVGNGQSRNVAIRDCTYAYVHTFLTNKAFGRGVGTLGGPVDNVSGGVSYQTIDVHSASSLPLTISHLYFEVQCRIGVASNNSGFNNTIRFQSCTFDLAEFLLGATAGAMLECGSLGAVHFSGCTFSLARRMFNLVSGASFVGIESCLFGIVSDYRGNAFYADTPPHIARALAYTCGGAFLHADALRGRCALSGGNTGIHFDAETHAAETASYSDTVVAKPGGRVLLHHYATRFVDRFGHAWALRERRAPALIGKRPGKDALLRTLSFAAPDVLRLELAPVLETWLGAPAEPGDILCDPTSGTIFAIAAVSRQPGALVLEATQLTNLRLAADGAVSGGAISTAGGYLWLYPASILLGDTVYFGDFSAGSRQVTNVHRGDGSAEGLAANLRPGDTLHFSRSGPPLAGSDRACPYPAMTAIAATDEAQRSVALTQPAAASGRFMLSPVALSG